MKFYRSILCQHYTLTSSLSRVAVRTPNPDFLESILLRISRTSQIKSRFLKIWNFTKWSFSGLNPERPTSLKFNCLRNKSILYSNFIFSRYESNGDIRYLKQSSEQKGTFRVPNSEPLTPVENRTFQKLLKLTGTLPDISLRIRLSSESSPNTQTLPTSLKSQSRKPIFVPITLTPLPNLTKFSRSHFYTLMTSLILIRSP